MLPIAPWLDHTPCVRKVNGSIPVGNSVSFLVPRKRHYRPAISLVCHHHQNAAVLVVPLIKQWLNDCVGLSCENTSLSTFCRCFNFTLPFEGMLKGTSNVYAFLLSPGVPGSPGSPLGPLNSSLTPPVWQSYCWSLGQKLIAVGLHILRL